MVNLHEIYEVLFKKEKQKEKGKGKCKRTRKSTKGKVCTYKRTRYNMHISTVDALSHGNLYNTCFKEVARGFNADHSSIKKTV